MPSFSAKSRAILDTVEPRLRSVYEKAIQYFDIVILEGRRDRATQDRYYAEGRSKTPWPKSRHNAEPPALSKAVDAGLYPIEWPDESFIPGLPPEIRQKVLAYGRAMQRWGFFGGIISAIAAMLGVKIRWGGDWDSDGDMSIKDNNFNDLPHTETVE